MLTPSATIAPLHDDPRLALQLAARLGYRRVTISAAQPGFRPRELDRSARRGLVAELRRMELHCDAMDLFIPPEHLLQPEHVDRAVEAVSAAMQLAGDIGASVLFVRLPPQEPGEDMPESVRAIEALAHATTVRIADVARNGRGMCSIATDGDSPIGIGLDTAAWIADGCDPIMEMVTLGGHLAGMRLVDLDETGTRAPVSHDGRVDLHALHVALQTGASPLALVADARGWVDPAGGLQQTRAAWDACGGGEH